MYALLLLACADFDFAAEKGTDNGTDTGGGSDSTDTVSDSADTPEAPAWYAVGATLTVADAAPTTDGGSVHVDVVDADLERVDCDVEVDADGLEVGEPPTAAIGAWWRVPAVPEADCAALPAALGLGIGELDPEIRAQLGGHGLDDDAEHLWGAWVQIGDDVLAVGYAQGSDADAEVVLPPPDDVYSLVPLLLVPL